MILGVSFDTVADNEAFARKNSFDFPLLCDEERKIGLAYGATDSATGGSARRIAYVIDPEGKIAQAHSKVDARSFAAEQLKTI